MKTVAGALSHEWKHVSVVRKSQGPSRPFGGPLTRHMPDRIIYMRNDTSDTSGEPVTEDTVETQVNSPGLAKGQGTAIVTGVISIIFGIAYLALVQVMDMRGGELQPPPPEAFLN
jgi:hypothetical protein